MGKVTSRTSQTSRAVDGMTAWINPDSTYSVFQLNIGSNPNSKLEIVSALNSFNLANRMFQFYYPSFISKYNPKVYFGTIQSVADSWQNDVQTGQTNGLPDLPGGSEKSGSCFTCSNNNL